MALDVTTETVSCDDEDCSNTAPIANSVVQGWWFTVEPQKDQSQNRYTDYCPECSGGRKINITPPEPETKK